MSHVTYPPTLDLFLYDFREGLGQNNPEIEEQRRKFKLKLSSVPDDIKNQVDEYDARPDEHIELFGREPECISPFECENKEGKYEGYLYPTRLSDSYGLVIDCSYICGEKPTEHLPNYINNLKQIIESKLGEEKAELGQTWVFYTAVMNATPDEYNTIAQNCYQALIPTADWQKDMTGKSQFSGGKLFELRQENDKTTHVLIILFDDKDVAKNLMSKHFNPHQLYWFWYRHKITWAFAQSRQLESLLKKLSVKIDDLFFNLSQEKEDTIKKATKVFRLYFKGLSDFTSQIHTIEMNLPNYQKRISKLHREIAGLQISDEFERQTKETYLPHLQKARAIFELQLETIRTIISTAQVEETRSNTSEIKRNVSEIVSMQRKVEWLEVFFASYYAAALTHYIFHGEASSITIAGWAMVGGLVVSLLLKPWEDSNEKTKPTCFRKYKKWVLLGGFTLVAAMGWLLAGYWFFIKNL
ncbi:MAG: hypothetical protein BWK79_10315 [Beggiatoa sp. IS2]|nr:MAG: hypothetical protein BWK79_10315 [Beggiatoa sp. IS2]